MRIVHTADVHIKDAESLDAMRAVIDCAKNSKADAILVAGDLFDKDYSHRTLEGELVGILESFAGEILVLPGNHDAEFLKTRKSLSRNSRVLDSENGIVRENLGGVELVALPFRDDAALKDYGGLSSNPANSILAVHGSFYTTEFFYDSSDRKSYFPVFEEDVRDKFRYVALGHYHRVIRKRFGKTEVVNPGSPRVTRAGDYGERVAALLDTDGWKVDLIPLAVAYDELVELTVSAFDTPEAAMKRLSKRLEGVNARVVVKLTGMLPPDTGSPSDWAELARKELDKSELEGSCDVSGAVQLRSDILANPFVQRLLSEAETLADDRGEDADRAKLIALERIASIIK